MPHRSLHRTGRGRAPGGFLGLGRTLMGFSVFILVAAFVLIPAPSQSQVAVIAVGSLLLLGGIGLIVMHYLRQKKGSPPNG